MKDGTVYINDKKLKESYVSSECDTNQVFYVPDNSYLFLGDNRANSSDARYWENPYINKKYIKAPGWQHYLRCQSGALNFNI